MEEDLRILNVEYLSNHWSNFPQILNLSLGDQTQIKNALNEDDLHWKTVWIWLGIILVSYYQNASQHDDKCLRTICFPHFKDGLRGTYFPGSFILDLVPTTDGNERCTFAFTNIYSKWDISCSLGKQRVIILQK